ncbi:hypothetical protein BT96DRAFT_1017651 [Gymnopus androsaceus JB14]|uniref:Mid2 domain-containing protein n=1 Tax=Gymnopus androsaceus JB14 TaxID=1447944 RepID=A0A6A4HX45_9AGAR|nr:hypothetical protein BT96DRAFT_1017651 [Gymnopus androsaceus JB14]
MQGTPRIYPLGLNTSDLTWQMDYEAGTLIALQVIDADGNTGGVDSVIYTSTGGSTTDCVVSDISSNFTVSNNVTIPSNLSTCDPWGVTVEGGSYPYTFSILSTNSLVVNNITTTSADQDMLVWINRADPNGILFAAASDSTGKYAYATSSAVYTEGSSYFACAGLQSTLTSSNSSDSVSNSTSGPVASPVRSEFRGSGLSTTKIIAIVVPIAAILIAFLGLFLFCRRRRASRMQGSFKKNSKDEYIPRPFQQHNYSDSTGLALLANHNRSNSEDFYDPYSGHFAASFPSLDNARASPSPQPPRGADSIQQDRPITLNESQCPPYQSEIVVQHHDGGATLVREIPPPYGESQQSLPTVGTWSDIMAQESGGSSTTSTTNATGQRPGWSGTKF